MTHTSKMVVLSVAACLAWANVAMADASEKIVTVGTAGVTGVYYPAGGAICRLVNRSRKETGVRCTVESTGGSINNLEAIRKGEMEFGVIQSDLLYYAYNGNEIFADVGADPKLRVLFSLHSEPFTVLVRKDAKINSFDDLKGKRVYMGAPGSGMRATMEMVMSYKGWTNKSFTSVADLKSNDQGQALCSGKIDAMIYAGGHPNGTIQQVANMCGTRIVDVVGPQITKMIEEHPFYSAALIPSGMYKGTDKDVHTFGVHAVLVASADLDEAIAYNFTKSVFDNLDNFKTLHPVFATLDAEHMAQDHGVIPIHPGALKYYQEKGLAPAQ